MKPRLTKRWIKALRSGEYKQGQCYLKKEDKYCCLGVLIEVVNGPEIFEPFKDYLFQVIKGTPNCCSLPQDIINKIEISYEIVSNLINMNDNLNYSFDQIANYLEEELKKEKENEKVRSTGS